MIGLELQGICQCSEWIFRNNHKNSKIMKLYKIIFLFWIYNIFAIFQFSWMAGVWFDSEDLMQRSDYEIYKPPLWQYQLYYILFGAYVVICSLLLYLWQKKIRDAQRTIIIWVLHIIWVLFFILGWMIAI